MGSAAICVVGDFDPGNETHRATNEALAHTPGSLPFEWLGTDRVGDGEPLGRYAGILIAPASPYRDMGGALRAAVSASIRSTLGSSSAVAFASRA